MLIEAVTVCVNYDDFLSQTVIYNRPLFDRWIVVTTPGDQLTRDLCRQHNLTCIQTSDGTSKDAAFNKGRMIERGLQHTSSEGWRIHLDADIALPANTRRALELAELQPSHIYGIDRALVKSWAEWKRVQDSGYLDSHHDWYYRLRMPTGLELGVRWASPVCGWCPIGFFQMWHSSQDEWRGVRVKPYPNQHGNACRADVQHALQWDRPHRELIPEIIAIHLESQDSPMGSNWNGRTTNRFLDPASLAPGCKPNTYN